MMNDAEHLPQELQAMLKRQGLSGLSCSARSSTSLPAVAGSYLLILRLDTPLSLTGGRFAGNKLPAGWFLYSGSARGPGGLRARVGRHLRHGKSKRWHIDWLTEHAQAIYARCFTQLGECDIITRLAASSRFTPPLPGFGSSDCRTCTSHLLFWKTD